MAARSRNAWPEGLPSQRRRPSRRRQHTSTGEGVARRLGPVFLPLRKVAQAQGCCFAGACEGTGVGLGTVTPAGG
jgi:hypothetical protein